MTTTLSLSRTRGDTWPIRMTFTNPDGTPMDLTNKQVILTANTEENPIDTTNQVFQIVGTITDAEAGKVEFPLSPDQADNVGTFYFDVEVSGIAYPSYLWTAESGTLDDPYPNGEGDAVWMHKNHANDEVVYAQRDGVDVARFKLDAADNGGGRSVAFDAFPVIYPDRNWRFSGLVYMTDQWYMAVALRPADQSRKLLMYVENDSFAKSVEPVATIEDPATHLTESKENTDARPQPWVDGWIEFVFELLSDGTLRGKGWQPDYQSEPGWLFTDGPYTYPPPWEALPMVLNLVPSSDVDDMDLAWLKVEEIL